MSSKYETISVLKSVKRKLEEAKGDRDWSSFLLRLLEENKKFRKMLSFQKLVEVISEEDIESILRESAEFRERFKLGGR